MGDQLVLPNVTGPALVVGPVFLCFELEGKPGHKARHRSRLVIPSHAWTQIGGQRAILAHNVKKIFIHNYAEPTSAAYEKTLAEAAKLFMRRRLPSTRPVALLVHAFKPIPVSWSRRDRDDALIGRILPTVKPDEDNYLKIRDALNGIAFVDDSQVVDGRAIKLYSDRPALRIEIREFVDPSETPVHP